MAPQLVCRAWIDIGFMDCTWWFLFIIRSTAWELLPLSILPGQPVQLRLPIPRPTMLVNIGPPFFLLSYIGLPVKPRNGISYSRTKKKKNHKWCCILQLTQKKIISRVLTKKIINCISLKYEYIQWTTIKLIFNSFMRKCNVTKIVLFHTLHSFIFFKYINC